MKKFDEWIVEDSGKILHIHDGGELVESVQRGLRDACKQCSVTVPTAVKLAALKTEQGVNMTAENETPNEEVTETPEVQEIPELNETPEVVEPSISANAPTIKLTEPMSSAPSTVKVGMPNYQTADAVSLFFDGKPDDSVRTILKGAGFIWQPRLLNPHSQGSTGAWIGLKANLAGTPFEME